MSKQSLSETKNKLAMLGGSPTLVDEPPAWPFYDESDKRALIDVLESRVWGGYHQTVGELERRFAAYHGVSHGIATANGTVSLEIALIASGIRPGDEVIVPPITFIASATAIARVGAVPVFVDVDAQTINLNPDCVLEAITERTRAVMVVHFAGCPADLDRFHTICHQHNLILIEDCAHAHGAKWRGQSVGSFGHFASFSFQASKNMTSGEGGILITNDPELAEHARSISNQGRRSGGEWYEHIRLGTNARLAGFQAALLLNQLDRLPKQLSLRMQRGEQLRESLRGVGGLTPTPEMLDEAITTHGYHLFSMRYEEKAFEGLTRERVIEALRAEGVPVTAGYPQPIYRQPLFQQHRHIAHDCPEAEKYCQSAIWLPHNVLLAEESYIEGVAAAISKVRDGAKELARSL